MTRRLGPEELALWRKVVASVRPLHRVAAPDPVAEPPTKARGPVAPLATPRPAPDKAGPGTTLDATWDRRLARGLVAPDRIVDLHGTTSTPPTT